MDKEDKITYISEIKAALEQLGGIGSLKDIKRIIEERDKLPSIHTNINWKNQVSNALQTHCKESNSYKGEENLFYSVYGIGKGYWGLIDFSVEDAENRICDEIKNDSTLKSTEKEMLIKARNGQGVFRERIVEKYHKCIITGISDSRLLIASHIRPWRSADNVERLSEENGLLLSPLYDKLFDIGLISFSKDMKIIVSNQMNKEDVLKIGFDTDRIYLPSPSKELRVNMEYHRDNIFKG
ncbi:MAG: HNH endonuclease [Acutalibacteraceae bacterium]